MAKERGWSRLRLDADPSRGKVICWQKQQRYIDAEKGVATAEEALQGAMDIIAEQIADDAKIRAWVRRFTFDHGMLRTEAKDAKQEIRVRDVL